MQLLKSVILYSACTFLILNVSILQVHSYNSNNKTTFTASHMQSNNKSDMNIGVDLRMNNQQYISKAQNGAEVVSDEPQESEIDEKKIVELFNRKLKSLNTTEVIPGGTKRGTVLHRMNYLKRLRRRANLRSNDIFCGQGRGSHDLGKCIRKSKRSLEQNVVASNIEELQSDVFASNPRSLFNKRASYSKNFNPKNHPLNKQRYKPQSYKKNKLKQYNQANKFNKANPKKISKGKYSNKLAKQHSLSGKNRYASKKGINVSRNKINPNKLTNPNPKDGKKEIYPYSKVRKNDKFVNQKSMKNYKKAPKISRKISDPETEKIIASGKLKKYNKQPNKVESRKNKLVPVSKVKNQNIKKKITEAPRKPASKLINKNMKKNVTAMSRKPESKVNNKNIKKNFADTSHKPDVNITIKLSGVESKKTQTINEKNPIKSKRFNGRKQKEISYGISNNSKLISTSEKNIRDMEKKIKNLHKPEVKISIMSPDSKSKALITVKDNDQHNYTRSKRMKGRLNSNEFQKIKVKRKVGLHRNFPARNHPGHKRSVNIRKQSILKSLDRSTRDDKAKILYEVKDFIVKNFRNREQRHTFEKLHGQKKRNDEKENSYSRKKENASANSSEFSNISGNENGNFGLLEEIKDFVVQNFHPEKSKRNTSDNETHDEMSKTVKRETNRPPSFASENVTLSEYDADLDNNPKREADSRTVPTSYLNENALEEKYFPTESSSTTNPSVYSSSRVYEVDHEYNDMTDDSIAIKTNDKDGYGTSDLISSKIKRETDPSESSEIYADDSVTNFKNADEKADDEAVSETEDTSTTDNNENLKAESYSENVFTSKSSQLFAHPALNVNFESEDQNSENAFSNLRRSFSSSTSVDVENLPSPLPSLFYNELDRKSGYLLTENPSAPSGEFISDVLSSTQSVLSDDDYVNYHESSSVYPEQFSASFVQQKVKASREDQNVSNEDKYDYEQLPEATYSSESFPGAAKDTFYTPQNKGLKTSRLKKLKHPSELLKFNQENVDYNEDLQSDESSVENLRLNSRDTTAHSVETYSSNGKNYQQIGHDYYFEDTPDSEVTSSTQTTKRAKHILTKSLRQHKNMNNFKNSQFVNENDKHELSNPITHALGKNVFGEQQHDKETEYDYEVSTQSYETDSTTDISKRDYKSTALQMTNDELPYLVNTKQTDNKNQNTMTSADYEENSSRSSNPLLGKRQGDVQKQQDTAEHDYEVNADTNDSGSTTSKEELNSIANAVTQIQQKDLLQRAENSLESSVAENEDEQKPDSRVLPLNKKHVKSIKENVATSDYDYGSNEDSNEERTSSSSTNTETHASESELFGEGIESTKGFYYEKLDQNENKDVVIRNHQTKNLKQQEDYANAVKPTDGENIEEAETVNSELNTDVQASDKEEKNTNLENTFFENVQNNDRSHLAKYFTVKRNNKTLEQVEKADYKNKNALEPKNMENSKNEMSSSTVNTADEIFHKDVFGDNLAVDLQNSEDNSEDENEEEKQILSDSSMHSPTVYQNRNEKETKERNPKPEVEYSYENPADSNDSEDIITEISNSIKNNKWVPSRKGLPEDSKEETSEYSQNDSEDKNEDSTDFASFQDASGKRFDQTSDEIRSYASDLQSLHFSKEALRTTGVTLSITALTNDPSENFLPNDLTQGNFDNSNIEYDEAYENIPDSTIEVATVAMKSGRESRNLKESIPSSTPKEEKLTPSETISVSPIQSSTNQMASVTEINSPDTEMTTEIYDINSTEDVGIRDISNNASNLSESFTTTLNTTEMSEIYANTNKRGLESNTTLLTHAATLQNVQIMPEITTVNREARNFNTIPEEEESTTLLEEDYQNSNDTNEDYYAETINSNNDKLSEYSSINATAVSLKNKRTANENEEVEHKDDSVYIATEDEYYDVTSTASENEDEENVSTNPVEDNDFEVESVAEKNSGKFPTRHKTKREGDEKLKEYFDSITRFKHRNLRNSYESMTHIKTRKTRDIQSLKPTILLPVEQPKTSAWLFGFVGVLAASSITLGLYHIIPKRSKIENMLSDYEVFTDDSRRAELCNSDIDASDKWLEEVKHINSFISEVLQKCENSRDGSIKEKYSTSVHLSKIHAAMTGTIN